MSFNNRIKDLFEGGLCSEFPLSGLNSRLWMVVNVEIIVNPSVTAVLATVALCHPSKSESESESELIYWSPMGKLLLVTTVQKCASV